MENKSKGSYLSLSQTLLITWWSIFSRWRVELMMQYEEMGMVDIFAYKRVKRLTKEQGKILLESKSS